MGSYYLNAAGTWQYGSRVKSRLSGSSSANSPFHSSPVLKAFAAAFASIFVNSNAASRFISSSLHFDVFVVIISWAAKPVDHFSSNYITSGIHYNLFNCKHSIIIIIICNHVVEFFSGCDMRK